MALLNGQDDMANNVPLFAEVRLSVYNSDDAAMFEAYNYFCITLVSHIL